jgi:hydrogenase nickel incorporation protein HypA/HybF
MHEMSLCRALLTQVEAAAGEQGAKAVTAIRLIIGPLSGVEIALLEHAYPLAARGTLAEGAQLAITQAPVRVRCLLCGETSEAQPNNLCCTHCDAYRTQLLSGDEMLLEGIEFTL